MLEIRLPLTLRPKCKYSALGILICRRREKKLQEKALCICENPKNAVHFIKQQFGGPRSSSVKILGAHFCCRELAHLFPQAHRLLPDIPSLLHPARCGRNVRREGVQQGFLQALLGSTTNLLTSLTVILSSTQGGQRDFGGAKKKGKEGEEAIALKHGLPERLKPTAYLQGCTPSEGAGNGGCGPAGQPQGHRQLCGAGQRTTVHEHRPRTVAPELASSPSPQAGLH